MNIEQAIGAYVKIRDRRKVRKEAYDEADAADKDMLAKIEAGILKWFTETGQTSAKTGAGTCYRSRATYVSLADKGVFMDFVKANNAFDLLEFKAAKAGVEQYLEEHKELPPGVNMATEETLRVNRPSPKVVRSAVQLETEDHE